MLGGMEGLKNDESLEVCSPFNYTSITQIICFHHLAWIYIQPYFVMNVGRGIY